VICGRKLTERYRGQLQTVKEGVHLPNPVIRSHSGHGFIKQYVRDRWLLRTEAAANNVADYAVPKRPTTSRTSGRSSHRCATSCPNSVRKAWCRNFRTPDVSAHPRWLWHLCICLVFLKLVEPIYAPLTAGRLRPFASDTNLQRHRLAQLDKLYQRVSEVSNVPFRPSASMRRENMLRIGTKFPLESP
jgi:hypothetical protein